MESPMIYELRRPKNFKNGASYPAIFLMHGIGSNEKNMLSLVDDIDDSIFIFSIRGQLSHGPGFAYFTIQGYGKPHREVFDEGVNRLANFIDYACTQYPLDLSRIYLLGFSQGAILAMTLGLTLENKIKGVVALSGYIPLFVKEEFKHDPGNQLSVFISHGEMDQVLPYEWGIENVEFFRKLGTPVTFKTYPEGHTVSIQNLQDFKKWILSDLQNS